MFHAEIINPKKKKRIKLLRAEKIIKYFYDVDRKINEKKIKKKQNKKNLMCLN